MSESHGYKKRRDLGMGVFEKEDGTIWKRAGVDGNYTYYGGHTEEELGELENQRALYNKYYNRNSQGKGLSQMTDKEKKEYYESEKDTYYKGEPQWYNKGPLAKRNLGPSRSDGSYSEPDSAHFSHIQRIVKDKNEQLVLNQDHALTDFSTAWLNNHYDERVYDEIKQYVGLGRLWKTNTGARTIQKFLIETGILPATYTNSKTGEKRSNLDGLYGTRTKEAAKDYLRKYSTLDRDTKVKRTFENAKNAAKDLYNKYIKSPVDDLFGE